MSSRVKKNVVLIGMPGCGKSVIGEMLSKDIGYEFCDMDKYIEKMSGKTIKELFEVSEKHFRDLESKSCEELAKEERLVIASGGGVIKRGENIQELKRSSLVVFINRPINNILADIDISGRPLLKDGKERLYKLYNERFKLYRLYGDVEILNDGEILDTVDKIKEAINEKVMD